jgi:hypothetical protein
MHCLATIGFVLQGMPGRNASNPFGVLLMSDSPITYRPRCKNLCCKSMLVYGEAFEQDPEFQAGMAQFWCTRTSKGQGPDGDDVALDLCSNPERKCFKEF